MAESFEDERGRVHFTVRCPPVVGDFVSGCLGNHTSLWDGSPEDAARRWNTRPTAQAVAGDDDIGIPISEQNQPLTKAVAVDDAMRAVVIAACDHIESIDGHDGNPVPMNRESGTTAALRDALDALQVAMGGG